MDEKSIEINIKDDASENITFDVSAGGSSINFSAGDDKYYAGAAREAAKEAEKYAAEAQQAAETAVDEGLKEAEKYAQDAAKSAETSKLYAEQAVSGMLWIELKWDEWIQENGRYKRIIENLAAVTGIFKGSWQYKQLVNADLVITDAGAVIYSYEAFDGWVLGSVAIIESEDDLLSTLEILDAMLKTEIIDLQEE